MLNNPENWGSIGCFQCFNTLTDEEKELSLTRRFGKTMQHAGVAITITSLTDIVAFGIGGTTVLPALKSFCLFASVGIVAIYFFQVNQAICIAQFALNDILIR